MGWKNVREYFGIEMDVQVSRGEICIGRGCYPDLFVIGADGMLKSPRPEHRSFKEAVAVLQALSAQPDKIKELAMAPDTFGDSKTVYTYSGGEVLEKKCERIGYPNVTHDGIMMFENTFTRDRSEAVRWAKRDAELSIREMTRAIGETEARLAQQRAVLAEYEGNQKRLQTDYPEQ